MLKSISLFSGCVMAEGIYQMEKGSLRAVLSNAPCAACQKSAILEQILGKDELR